MCLVSSDLPTQEGDWSTKRWHKNKDIAKCIVWMEYFGTSEEGSKFWHLKKWRMADQLKKKKKNHTAYVAKSPSLCTKPFQYTSPLQWKCFLFQTLLHEVTNFVLILAEVSSLLISIQISPVQSWEESNFYSTTALLSSESMLFPSFPSHLSRSLWSSVASFLACDT